MLRLHISYQKTSWHNRDTFVPVLTSAYYIRKRSCKSTGLPTDRTRTANGLPNGQETDIYGLATDSRSAHTRAAHGLLTNGQRTKHGHTTDKIRTHNGLHTDLERTSHGQNTDGPRFVVRVGSWILVFGKRRAGEIATLRLYHKTRQPDTHRRKR